MEQSEFAGEFREGMPFLGGSLWIDFLNTMPVIKGEAMDFLASESSITRWARQANIAIDANRPVDSPADLHRLRQDLADAFDRLAEARPLSIALIARANALIAHSAVRSHIIAAESGAQVVEQVALVGPPVATAVAWDFARFLSRFEHQRMRHCGNPACVMQFYDTGKNNRRRWCTMSICGNRDKVAHYRGRKSTGSV